MRTRRWALMHPTNAWARSLSMLACFGFAFGMAISGTAAETPRAVHGSADIYSMPGLAIAWGVLRGANEAAAVVVVRIVVDPVEYRSIAATGSDPFTQRTKALLPATPVAGPIDLRVPRAHFADYPRTDLRFYASPPVGESPLPKLVVFYLGVPDTTPEFASEAALDAYLADRLARARNNPGGKPP